MHFISTRGGGEPLLLEAALQRGIAADGGLFVPTEFPRFTPQSFADDQTPPAIARRMLEPFFAGTSLAPEVGAIAEQALSFPLPLIALEAPAEQDLSVLELFHGPTAAFKDVGARFLAACLTRLEAHGSRAHGDLTILVATSGDTGGAVAAAFHRQPGIRIVILFPRGLVSARQEHQLCCWGDNVSSLSVDGPFDVCQALVKAAFADQALRDRVRLSSANSINIGRLLPQAAYYAASSLAVWRRTGAPANYIVPTGNLGNALACVWARKMGLPIGQVILATNANRTIPDYLASGDWQPRDSVATLASAMDVGNPSNMERLRHQHPAWREVTDAVSAYAVSDAQIREQIRQDAQQRQQIWCPHTATALHVYDQLPDQARRGGPWVAVATAHPAKFDTIVEPLIGHVVEVPPALAAILDQPAQAIPIAGHLDALAAQV
ncbi:MAG: threonine synthase [Pseudomonadota bacterium]